MRKARYEAKLMEKKKKILQINSCNFGSTGNIMLNISKTAQECEYTSFVAYANSRSNKKKNVENSILIGNIIERNLHLKLAYYTGYNGCFSQVGTQKFLSQIEKIRPDIIHLHNLHNCYINLKMLFEYIKEKNIPVVWTLHDCWAFTGQCPHFTEIGCNKWKTGCSNCSQFYRYPASRVDKTREMYALKKEWFTDIKNLQIITPSQWLADRVTESFLGCYSVKVINNGIDLSIFKPTPSDFRERYRLQNKKVLLGVANTWSKTKGLNIFVELSRILDEKYKIVLVGLSKEELGRLPKNIIGLPRTSTAKELAVIYSAADWFINPSTQETMGLVTAEALACGTPAIVTNSTAVAEPVDSSCGIVVDRYNTKAFYDIIINNDKRFSEADCTERASAFNMETKYREYVEIYKSLLDRVV
ncbi:MAG: glycosyltransferase [Clostridia bacterium]|nr:glycosyltransferase [Clostridia bacterium]